MIAEPTTTLTDYLVAIASTWWGVALLRDARRRGSVAARWWGAGFLAVAVAAAAGGTVHGFGPALGADGAAILWRASLAALAAFAVCAAATAIADGVAPEPRGPLPLLVGALFAAALTAAILRPAFSTAIVIYGLGLGALVVQQAVAWIGRRAPSGPWIVAGGALAAAGSLVQHLGLAPHPRFNHNDLFHVIELGAGWLFYRGGRRLGEPVRA